MSPKRRVIPQCPEPPARPNNVVARVYGVTVVTPLFGGGAKAGRVDADMPIRGTSVRGQLRFWWRFACGYKFGSVADMRAREFEVWGSPDNPSPVQVRVELDRKTLNYRTYKKGEKVVYGFKSDGPEAYALFSAKQNEVERVIREGLKFKLHLTWPTHAALQRLRDRENEQRRKKHDDPLPPAVADITPDIETAAMAWLRFGGIGSRTRRGLGAVHLADGLQTVMLPKGARLIRAGAGTPDPMQAWWLGMNVYQQFRQKAFRNDSPRHRNRPGRSRWPEPDALRHITGCSTPDHRTPTVPQETIPSFPKAALGLPIVFKFADGPDDRRDTRMDPCRLTLFAKTGEEKGKPTGDRMASPLVIRPMWNAGLNQWVTGFLFLPRPEALKVEAYIGAGPGTQNQPVVVPNAQIVGDHLSVLEPMSKHDNAIDAFYDFAFADLADRLGVQPQVAQG